MIDNSRYSTNISPQASKLEKYSENIEEYASGKDFEKYASYILEEALEKIDTNLHLDIEETVKSYIQSISLASKDTRPTLNSTPLYKYIYKITSSSIIETLSTFSFVTLLTSENVITFRTGLFGTKIITQPDSFLINLLLRVSEKQRAEWEDFVDYNFDLLTCYVEDQLAKTVDIFILSDVDAIIDDKITYETFRPLIVGKKVQVTGIYLHSNKQNEDIYSVLHAQRGQFTVNPTRNNINDNMFKFEKFYARAVSLSCTGRNSEFKVIKDEIIPSISGAKIRKTLIDIILTYFSISLFKKTCMLFSNLKHRRLLTELKRSRRHFSPTWFSANVLKNTLILWNSETLDEILKLEPVRKLVGVIDMNSSNLMKVLWLTRNSKNVIEILATFFRKRNDIQFLDLFVDHILRSNDNMLIEMLSSRKLILNQLIFNEFERILLSIIGSVEYLRIKNITKATGRSLISFVSNETINLIEKRLAELKKYRETVSQNPCIHISLLASVFSMTRIRPLRAFYDRLTQLMQERIEGEIYCTECNIYMMCKHQKLLFEEKLHGVAVSRELSRLQAIEDSSVICKYCGELFFTVPKDNEEDLSSALSKMNRWRTDSTSDPYELTTRQTIILLSREIRVMPPPNVRDIASYVYRIIGDILRTLQTERVHNVKNIESIAIFSRRQEVYSIYYTRVTIYAVCVNMHISKRAFISFNLSRRPIFTQELVKDVVISSKLSDEEISQIVIASRSMLEQDFSFMLADTISEKFTPDEKMFKTVLTHMIQIYTDIKRRGGIDVTIEDTTFGAMITTAFDLFTLVPFVKQEKIGNMFRVVQIAETVKRKFLNIEAFEYDIQNSFMLPIVEALRENGIDEKIISAFLLVDKIPPPNIIITIWYAFVDNIPTVPISWRTISRTFIDTYRNVKLLDDILEHLLYTAPRRQVTYLFSLRHLTKERACGHHATSIILSPQIRTKEIDDEIMKSLWSDYCLVETDNELMIPHEFIGEQFCNRCKRTYNEIKYISDKNFHKFKDKLKALAKLVINTIKIFPAERIVIVKKNEEVCREIGKIIKDVHTLKENIHSKIMQICAVHDSRLHENLIERLTSLGSSTKEDITERTMFVASLARKILCNAILPTEIPKIYIYIINYITMLDIDEQDKYLASIYALVGLITLIKKADEIRNVVSYILETEKLLSITEQELIAYRRRIEYEDEKRHLLYLKGDLMDKIRTGLEYMIGAEQEEFFAHADERGQEVLE